MKKQNFWIIPLALSFGSLISACSHTPKAEKVELEAPQFKVLEAAPGGREGWHDDPFTWAQDMGKDKGYDTDKFYFYSGEAHSASRRTACEKAQADLSDDIAKNVSQFVDSAVARAKSESSSESTSGTTGSSESGEEMSGISSQLSKAHLNGITIKKKYWEKRDYSEHGGAKSIYYCWVLAEVSKQDVANMINRAKTLRLQSNAELREKVDAKLSSLSAEYEKYQQQHQ